MFADSSFATPPAGRSQPDYASRMIAEACADCAWERDDRPGQTRRPWKIWYLLYDRPREIRHAESFADTRRVDRDVAVDVRGRRIGHCTVADQPAKARRRCPEDTGQFRARPGS